MIRGYKNIRDIERWERYFVFSEDEIKQCKLIEPNAERYIATFVETEKSKVMFLLGIVSYITLLIGLIIVSKGNLEGNVLNTILYMLINIYISANMWNFIFNGYRDEYAIYTIKWIRKENNDIIK